MTLTKSTLLSFGQHLSNDDQDALQMVEGLSFFLFPKIGNVIVQG